MVARRIRYSALAGAAVLAAGTGAAFLTPGNATAAPAAPAEVGPATVYVAHSDTDGLDSQVIYESVEGQRNVVTVTLENADDKTRFRYTIFDDVEIKPGYGCSHPDAASLTHVVCTIDNFEATETGPYPSLVMNLGDQNDVVRFANLAGADIYNGFSLGAGNDTFMTNQTNTFDGSSVWGEWGNDSITTRAGSMVDAGEGNDTVHALGRKAFATGGKGHDTLYGGAGSQELVGWTGNDVIRGGAGADVIQGDKGNDTLYGGAGADVVRGNSGNDRLFGGPGKDKLIGGPGRDVIRQS
ncbi:hypothetical protein [Kineosporia sp. NBRC 101677]|uniref:calcium-binding protein n=1 Tax=Kineosporia sp. NBRC 101677 TaxID=3032197 RepID=UPI0025550FFB|nr:hypothetical protein [Kineosporia sp. NBRC 101677]